MRYFLRKVGFFLLTLWAVVTLNFLIPRLQPGDPAEIMVQRLAGKDAQLDPAQVQAMRDMLGTPDRLAVVPVRRSTWASCCRATSGCPTPTTRSR